MTQKIIERSWFWRRWFVASQIAAIDLAVGFLLVYGQDNALHRDISQGLILLLATIINVYVLGGVWDHKNEGKEVLAAKAVDQSDPATTDVEIKP